LKEISCVLLAEPHHGLAEGTRVLLGTLFDTVVMVADESSLLETAERVRPALLMVDLNLAKKDVARFISRLKESSPGSKVIILSVHDEPTVAQAVLDAGADGFLVFDFKSDAPGLGKGGTGVLSVDGKEVARNSMEHTTPITFPEDETFDIGLDTRTGVAMVEHRYDPPFKFTGKIKKLTFELKPDQRSADLSPSQGPLEPGSP